MVNAYKLLVPKPQGKGPHNCKWGDDDKMHLGKIRCDRVDWIQLTHARVQCQPVLNMVMNFQVPQKQRTSLPTQLLLTA
jgi:hypothetical protein